MRKAGTEAPRAAREALESAQGAIALLEDVLDLSRLDANRLEPKIRETDLVRVVREAVTYVEPAAERRDIRIERTHPETLLASTDPQRVRQILINLLTNAVRHSPEGEQVSVELAASGHGVRIDVVDRGEGIAPEIQASIFDAFDRGAAESGRGTGLGLALSRRLARALGGDLRVESQPGAGARFFLVLPSDPDSL